MTLLAAKILNTSTIISLKMKSGELRSGDRYDKNSHFRM